MRAVWSADSDDVNRLARLPAYVGWEVDYALYDTPEDVVLAFKLMSDLNRGLHPRARVSKQTMQDSLQLPAPDSNPVTLFLGAQRLSASTESLPRCLQPK